MQKENYNIEIKQDELLKYAVENGILDLPHIQRQIEEMKRKELLDQFPYAVWQGKDGYWCTHLINDDGSRTLRKRKTKQEIEDVIVEYQKQNEYSPTIKELFNAENDRKLELNKISNATFTRNEQIFNRHFEEFGNRKVKSITVDDLVEFLEEQIPKFNMTSRAFANLKGIVGAIIKYSRRKKLISFTMDDVLAELDISEKEFRKTVKFDTEEVFTEEEMDKVVRYLIAHPDIWNLGILLLFVTGLRVGELVALHWDDVSSDSILVRRTETRFKNEGDKWEYQIKDFPKTEAGVRIATIPQSFQWVFGAIRELHDDEEFVFVRNGKRLNTNCMRKRFTRVCQNAGVPCRSPHKIRKTYCSILFENHVDSRMITSQMGHTDIMCSEIYYHRDRKSLDERAETISAIPDFKPKMTLVG